MAQQTQAYPITTGPHGLGILLHPMPHSLSVAVGIWVQAGGRCESAELAGISHFLEHVLFKGTRRHSCEALKRSIEGVGGSLNGFTAEEFTCYMAKVPKRYARRAADVLSEMALHPSLNKRDVERERDVILEEIRMYEDTPAQLVHDLFNQLLWPDHPLGRLLSGTIETVQKIRHADLVRYWKRLYQPRHMLLTGVGSYEADAIHRQIQRVFAHNPRPARSIRLLPAPRARRRPQVRVWKKDTEQTHLCLGTYAIPRTHPDRFALELLHVMLGANMSSRLFREVRERRGLVYEIGTQIKRFHDTGAFVVYAGCDANKLTETIQTICKELARIRRHPVTHAELTRAKDYYSGQLLMGLEDTMDHMLWIGEQAITVGRVASPQRLLQHLNRVRASDIQRVAQRLFHTATTHLAIVGPLTETQTSKLESLCRMD